MKRILLCVVFALALVSLAGARPTSAAPTTAVSEVDAKIEIVWPHNNASVSQARLANITVYLFEPGTLRTVPCDFNGVVRLWRALNNNPASNAGMPVGQKRLVTRGGVTFPVWDFNDVDVSPAANGVNKLYFYVTVDDVATNFNVWSHGADARTYLPQPQQPAGVLGSTPDSVNARVQVVWPHDRAGQPQPVARATLANVTVALFHATMPNVNNSVGTGFNRRVLLFKALNNGLMELVGAGVKRVTTQGGVTYPVWDFNDVDVSQARDPLNKVYFRVLVEDTRTFSTIWSHGADARTYFPTPDQPTGGCAQPGAAVALDPDQGPSGTAVRVRATGFPANTNVNALAGPENSEAIGIANGRTNASGVWEFNWRIQGGTGQRWRVTVLTVTSPGQMPISAQSEVFTITGQPPHPNLKYYWPTRVPRQMSVVKGESWADEGGYALAWARSNSEWRATLLGGSAAEAMRLPASPGSQVTVRSLNARAYTSGGGTTIRWEENGELYAIVGSLNLDDTVALVNSLESVSLSTWQRRLNGS